MWCGLAAGCSKTLHRMTPALELSVPDSTSLTPNDVAILTLLIQEEARDANTDTVCLCSQTLGREDLEFLVDSEFDWPDDVRPHPVRRQFNVRLYDFVDTVNRMKLPASMPDIDGITVNMIAEDASSNDGDFSMVVTRPVYCSDGGALLVICSGKGPLSGGITLYKVVLSDGEWIIDNFEILGIS